MIFLSMIEVFNNPLVKLSGVRSLASLPDRDW
jgi:hypothetical protein